MNLQDTATIAAELEKLTPSAIIELFCLDATALGEPAILYFHNGTQRVSAPIQFNGITYTPLPISVKEMSFTSEGAPPRPTLQIYNVGGFLSMMSLELNDLVGARFVRRRTFAKYLDHLRAPDVSPLWLPDDIFYVERKIRENSAVLEFELASALDMDGVLFPMRRVVAGYCFFTYRGDGCGFSAPCVVTDRDNFMRPGINKYRRSWIPNVVYSTGDTVSFESSARSGLFEALSSNLVGDAQSPANETYWKQLQRYRGDHDDSLSYLAGDVVRTVDALGNPLLFFAEQAVPPGVLLTNTAYWAMDVCTKSLPACRYRFDPRNESLTLPFGGFPGTVGMPDIRTNTVTGA